jgi:branched-chain amino acid transport system substrate-binding protein
MVTAALAAAPHTAVATTPEESTPATPAATDQPASGDPIPVAFIGMMTGPAGFFGTELQRGFDIAIEKVNAEGGINGAPIAITAFDTETDIDKAVAVVGEVIEDDSYVAVTAAIGGAMQLASVPDLQAVGIPTFSTAIVDSVVSIGDYVFRTVASDRSLIPGFGADVIERLDISTVGILHVVDDPSSVESYETYKEVFEENGVEIVADETYLKADTEWSSQLLKIAQEEPDVLLLVPYSQEGGSVLLQAREVGLDMPIIGSVAMNSLDALAQAGEAGNDLLVPDFWFAGADSPDNEYFLTEYAALYPDDTPTRFAATGYNNAMVLAESLRTASDPMDRVAVRDAAAAIESFHYLGCEHEMVDRAAVCKSEPVALISEDGQFVILD